jgi:hypothetical protein
MESAYSIIPKRLPAQEEMEYEYIFYDDDKVFGLAGTPVLQESAEECFREGS